MRLIDADALTELCDIMADKCDGIGESVWHQFHTTVEWSPTVDAVPVIRCKECKYRCETEDGEYNPEDIVCTYWMSDGLNENDYCSAGGRKENG